MTSAPATSLDPEFRLEGSPDREGLLLVLLRQRDHVELVPGRQVLDHLPLSRRPDDEAAVPLLPKRALTLAQELLTRGVQAIKADWPG